MCVRPISFSNLLGKKLTNNCGITISPVHSITLTLISHKYLITQIKISPALYNCCTKLKDKFIPHLLLPSCWSTECASLVAAATNYRLLDQWPHPQRPWLLAGQPVRAAGRSVGAAGRPGRLVGQPRHAGGRRPWRSGGRPRLPERRPWRGRRRPWLPTS